MSGEEIQQFQARKVRATKIEKQKQSKLKAREKAKVTEKVRLYFPILMTIYNLYFFNKSGTCVAYKEWCREKRAAMSQEEEEKLVYGMLVSLRSFSCKLSRKEGPQFVQNYRTSCYMMNYMETATGLKIVLNTDPDADGIPQLLHAVFQIYIETVLKNPFVDTSQKIQSDIFHSKIDEAIRGHHCYT